jgi:hypothetical protein
VVFFNFFYTRLFISQYPGHKFYKSAQVGSLLVIQVTSLSCHFGLTRGGFFVHFYSVLYFQILVYPSYRDVFILKNINLLLLFCYCLIKIKSTH